MQLTPIIEGNDAGETLVFIQGWPDDATLWDTSVAALGAEYRCVRVTLPNFDGERTTRRGHHTLEIVAALETLVRDAGRGQPVILVLHDWGCYWGHAVHNRAPDLVRAVAGVDVAPGEKKPAHFHSRAWVDHVRKVGGEVVGMPCDHWVPRNDGFAAVSVAG